MVALLVALFSLPAAVQQSGGNSEDLWRTYGYIALGALILIIIGVVLVRKQHRKFNE